MKILSLLATPLILFQLFIGTDAECGATGDGNSDVVILIDESASIDTSDFDTMTNYIADSLIPDVLGPSNKLRVGAVGFSDDAEIIYDINNSPANGDRTGLINAIKNNNQFFSTTDTFAGIKLAVDMMKNANNRVSPQDRFIILFTDGVPNENNLCSSATNINPALGMNGETVFTVAIGFFDRNALTCFFGPNEENLFETEFNDLNVELNESLEQVVCQPSATQQPLTLFQRIQRECNCGLFKSGDRCPWRLTNQTFPSATRKFKQKVIRRYRKYCRPYH